MAPWVAPSTSPPSFKKVNLKHLLQATLFSHCATQLCENGALLRTGSRWPSNSLAHSWQSLHFLTPEDDFWIRVKILCNCACTDHFQTFIRNVCHTDPCISCIWILAFLHVFYMFAYCCLARCRECSKEIKFTNDFQELFCKETASFSYIATWVCKHVFHRQHLDFRVDKKKVPPNRSGYCLLRSWWSFSKMPDWWRAYKYAMLGWDIV